MERNNGVRHAYIFNGKDVQLGWLYDSTKLEFFPPKVEKIYSSSEVRKPNFIINTKEDVIRYKSDGYYKDKQWYKDFHNSSAKEILQIDGTLDIEKRASEVISYELGQEVVTSLLNKINIVILIFLSKELPNGITKKVELRNFLDFIFEERDEAYLPDCLTDGIITTIIYNGNQKSEINNIVYALKEGCRVLRTQILKAKSAYIIDGKLQESILKEQILPKGSQKTEKRKPNTAEVIADSVIKNKKASVNQESESSYSVIPSAVKYSQMTKSETNQMSETITTETSNMNPGCKEKKIITSTEKFESVEEKCTNTGETKKIIVTRNQIETTCSEAEIHTKNQHKETINNYQTSKGCENQLNTLAESNTLKRERNSIQGRMPLQPSNINEPCSHNNSISRGRSNSIKRMSEKTSVVSCDTRDFRQEKLASNEKNLSQNIHSEIINCKQNQKEISYSVNDKVVKNEKEEIINHSQNSKESKNPCSAFTDNNTPKRERSISRGRMPKRLDNTNGSSSMRGQSSSRNRRSMDKTAINSQNNECIKQETCIPITKVTSQDMNKKSERNIMNSMQTKCLDHSSTSTKVASHQKDVKAISSSINSKDGIPKVHDSVIPRNLNESGKLFGNYKTSSITFELHSDIDKAIATVVNDLSSGFKQENNFSNNETAAMGAKSHSSNELKIVSNIVGNSPKTHESGSNFTKSDLLPSQVSQCSLKNHDGSLDDNAQAENKMHNTIIEHDPKLLKCNNSSTQHTSTVFKEKNSKESTLQCKSTLISSSQHVSTKTSNFFKILEPIRKVTDSCGIDKQIYGEFLQDSEEKVILLLGASGCGKTTLVNFVANYFEGVKSPDEKMVVVSPILPNNKQSHTQEIKAYSFCSEKENGINFTFIDTPGLNDSSGAEVRDHVQSLKTFLANMNANGLKIHAIGFVAQAHLVRLTSSERLVMDYVSSLFGEKVKDNIITFVTFADNQENPPVVEAVQNYGLKTKHFLKFNNSILSANTYEVDDLDRVYWRKGYKSLKKGIKIIKDMPPLCVNAMKALQKEVYSKTVVDGAMKDLEAEVLNFVYILLKEKGRELTKQASSQVWELATAAFYQIKQSNNTYASVEDLVREVTISVCQKKSIDPTNCLKYLTLAPNRGMKPAALATIFSLSMVYNVLKNDSSSAKNQTNKGKKNQFAKGVTLYCHQCSKEHLMERVSKTSWLGYNNKEITFKCKMCSCIGDMHGVKTEANSIDHLSINKIFQHARNGLCIIIQRYSIPGVSITDNELLQFLMEEEVAGQCKPFIHDLLHMKNV